MRATWEQVPEKKEGEDNWFGNISPAANALTHGN